MSRSLSTGQADELHKSILGYVVAQGPSTTVTTLRAELRLGEEAFPAATAHKYGKLLEKKWTTVAVLEAQNAKLEAQLRDAASAPASRRHDPAFWLPAAPPRVQLAAHAGSVNCVALHPVFTTLASGGDDCAVRVWDWELGELERTLKAHTQAVRDVDFGGGPRGGGLLASCGADLAVKLWDPADGWRNIKTLMGHEHAVTSVRFLPGEGRTLLVSASADRTLRVWDAATGSCVKTLQGHGDWVRCVCPSDDGRFVLSASSDRTARVWDLQSPDQGAAMTLVGHENAINTCAFAPASAYRHLSSLAAGTGTADSLSGAAAAFVATGARDKTIKLWDAQGNGACTATLAGHDSWVSALAFHPGGRYLLSAGDDKTLRFWDLTRKGQCVGILRGVHDGFITCLRWTPTMVTGKNRDKVDSPVSVARKGNRGDSMAHFRCVVATGGMDKKVKVFMNYL